MMNATKITIKNQDNMLLNNKDNMVKLFQLAKEIKGVDFTSIRATRTYALVDADVIASGSDLDDILDGAVYRLEVSGNTKAVRHGFEVSIDLPLALFPDLVEDAQN